MQIANKTNIFIRLSKNEYFSGDRINGEVLFHTEKDLPCAGVEMIVWCQEGGNWHESPSNTKNNRIYTPYEKTQYVGKLITYFSSKIVHKTEKNILAKGTYKIPFTYMLNHTTPASTFFKGVDFEGQTHHFIGCRLISFLPEPTQQLSNEKVYALEDPDMLLDDSNCLVSKKIELIILERKQFQATLRPYVFQCTLSIPHIIGLKEVKVVLKKDFEAVAAGAFLPLNLEVTNSSNSTVCGFLFQLMHTVSIRNHSGIFKSITYKCVSWNRPVTILPNSPKCIINNLLQIPENLPSTSHGSNITSEYNIGISCKYSRYKGMLNDISENDLYVPLTVFHPLSHPKNASLTSNFSHNLIFSKAHLFIDEAFDKIPEAYTYISEELDKMYSADDIKDLEPALFDLGSGTSNKSDIIEIPRQSKPPVSVEISGVSHIASVNDIIAEDLGFFPSTKLKQAVLATEFKKNRSAKTKNTVVVRAIAPLSK